MPALIIAAPRSGSGKTIVTLGIAAALRQRGLDVHAAKTGPDYIDPAFHEAAIGHPVFNLDSWAMPPALLQHLLADALHGSDILLIEGAMGLFDGASAPAGRTGSAADLAARFAIPVVLVVDVSGQAQSAAAVVRGFMAHRPGVAIAGVILNRVGSERHRRMIADAMATDGIRVVGSIPRDAALVIPERHLGLVQARENDNLRMLLQRLPDAFSRWIDLDALLCCAAAPAGTPGHAVALRPPGQRIAIASDDAFSFIYQHLLRGWREAGAEIVFFSPLADQMPPGGCDVCWLPGGYPELHAGRIAQAAKFRSGILEFAKSYPVHGECGGYMALGQTIEDANGATHEMLGLLGHSTSFAKRKLCLGYRAATLSVDSVLGRRGDIVRGHEFHYATLAEQGADTAFAELTDAEGCQIGLAGGMRGKASGTFFHALASAELP